MRREHPEIVSDRGISLRLSRRVVDRLRTGVRLLIRFRESRGDSHTRTVWWSVVRGTEEESSDARNRHRSTLGRPIRQRLYLDTGRFRVRLTTRKQHEDCGIIDTLDVSRDLFSSRLLHSNHFHLINPLARVKNA